jgi:tripartite-type tricarboxylate transporter receptor subunit TctC
MRLARRELLVIATSTAAAAVYPLLASALDYPSRPVRLIVGFFAGSLSDILARTIAENLSRRLGQQIIVDDQPGAGSNLATDLVVRASPDGYTLLVIGSANVWNAALYDKLSFDFIRDIAPVASISRTPGVMTVTQSLPAQTVPEFMAYAKANPGKINMASGGIGSLPHVAGELFKLMTGIDLVHIPYRGSYLPDLIGGQVQVAFSPIPTVIEQIRAGKLRPLAVTGTDPSAALPDVPTLDKFLPGYEASAFVGVGAPKNVPKIIIDKLNKAVNSALEDSDVQIRFARLGTVPAPMTAVEFGRLIVDEGEKWGKVLRLAGIKAE